jgi:hypothetical protein
MSYVTGVDVSSYQSADFDTSGLDFAIVKATESTTYKNPEYAAQVEHARAGGLVVGHYHFARSTDSAAEVAYFASVATVETGDIIALDWEVTSVTPAARDAWLADAKTRFPHNRVVLYCDVSFWNEYDQTHNAADGLWIADPGVTSPGTLPWLFWQYSSAGNIDHSYGNFQSLGALIAWVIAPAITPNEDDFMSVTSVAGRAGIAWPAGKCHSVAYNWDPAGGADRTVRVVLVLDSGPFVLYESFAPTQSLGTASFEIPAEHVPVCRGVILENANAAIFDVTAA